MPTPFSRTLRALDDDERGTAWTGAIAAALLAAWLAWFVASPVAVYETTDVARVEASQDVHAVQAPVAGVISCPCHGSQYDLEGRVRRGPAQLPLARYETEYHRWSKRLTVRVDA